MPGVFISYRWASAAAEAVLLYRDFSEALGQSYVAIDVASRDRGIRPGHNIARESLQLVGQAEVVICVVDPLWAHALDGAGRKKLMNREDPVRLELEYAL